LRRLRKLVCAPGNPSTSENVLAKMMDTRVKPAYDDHPVNPSLILFAKFGAVAIAIGRGFVSDV
jgi:hypothetical protein